jgi:hypothetical protein
MSINTEKSWVFTLKSFELTIPKEYIDYVNKEIKKPKRLNTELLELWLERELRIENEGTYGNLPVDESHVTIELLPNGDYKMLISDACFDMIVSHVQPEPHRRKMPNEDVLHFWLDIKTDKLHSKRHIDVRELPSE